MLSRILHALVLPAEITAFERQYLAKMNRIALYFFWAHLPVFVIYAWGNGTRPLLAALLTVGVLMGPTLALRVLDSPRSVSIVHGFTAMLMGGVLVHVGQGPMQIEMHFYFFVLLALLAVFANPMVVVVAAATAAIHHLLLWIWLPSSVFNYDAPIWVVGVHAAFVVLESVAACFIARSFFDNVIGLERIVAQRTAALDARNQDLRRVLDHLAQGLLIIQRDGRPTGERSRATDVLLGPQGDATTLGEWLGRSDPDAGSMLGVGLEQVFEEFLPPSLTLAQLPKHALVGDHDIALSYTAIGESPIEGVLVMLTDVTAERQRARLEAEQKELMALVDHALRDRRAVAELLAEGDERVRLLRPEAHCPPDVLRREVHTLKGNAALFGIPSIAELCHALETAMVSSPEQVPALAAEVNTRWSRLSAQLQPLLERGAGCLVELDKPSYDNHVRALRARVQPEELLRDVLRWPCEPVKRRLDRLGEQAQQIARRIGKPEPRVVIDDDGLRLDPARWAGFWQAAVHALRNAVDHGLEDAGTRRAAGKADQGELRLSCRRLPSGFEVVLADDGAGIDWGRVAVKAASLGLPHDTPEALLKVLCTDGISTKGEVSELSGRGVGMGALRAACVERGGVLKIDSERGKGTRIVMTFPAIERVTFQPVAA